MSMRAGALGLALLAGACGGEAREWRRAETAPEIRAEDETLCQRQARLAVAGEGYARRGAVNVPNFSVQRGDGRVRQTFQNEEAAERLAESARRYDLFSTCMEEKGYRLE